MEIEFSQLITSPRKETLSANIAAQLKSLIFKKHLKTGDRLPSERELAAMFGVSRVAIKQALLTLEHSGFLEIRLGSKGGAFVRYDFSKPISICMEDLQRNGELKIAHFDEVRRALECASIRKASQIATENQILKLKEINKAFIKPENRERHAELNIAFHVSLAEISGNTLIKILLSSLMDLVTSYPGPTISSKFIKEAYKDHEKIIAAIERRDPISAEQMLIKNIERVAATEW
jgi:GntR family transcriptional regulator, transcriptional repressor for pyruvate dehydrogenase complex